MKHLLILAVLQCAALAQDGQNLYRWSLVASAGAQGADIASSWGGIEANPVLGRGHRFGWQAASLKLGIAGGGWLIQRLILRRHPSKYRLAAVVNFGMAGATGAVAARNWRMR
jgi:hypothetical protein